MVYLTSEAEFNTTTPSVMHIDLNSCFASVEQQANPLLRHNPLAIAAYTAPYGCVLSPSIEAKEYGVKVGMTVAEAKKLCPWIIIKKPDPPKYRYVHAGVQKILESYTDHFSSKSIDEFVLYFEGYSPQGKSLENIGQEIKYRIKQEVGDWLKVSIGISTCFILAKLASGLHKPDGLDTLDHHNYRRIYQDIKLRDFCGINFRNEKRLNQVGIFTGSDFYNASLQDLKSAFQSVLGRYWYTRLRGYEIDDVNYSRKTYGQSYVLPHPMQEHEWWPILAKLVEKGTRRMREGGSLARGIHLSLLYGDKSHWHQGHSGAEYLFDPRDIYKKLITLYQINAPKKLVKRVAYSCFNLEKSIKQLTIFDDILKKRSLISSQDQINQKWGDYTLTSAALMGSKGHVKDAIAFGK